MPVSSVLAVAAGSWGILMSVAPCLQIRTIVRARSSSGVSLGYLRVLFIGFVLWLSYGVALAAYLVLHVAINGLLRIFAQRKTAV